MKGQIVPGNHAVGQGFLVFETEDGTHHEITNCFSASIENDMRERHNPFIVEMRPTGDRTIQAEFRVSGFTIDDKPPAKKDYDVDAEAVEDYVEITEFGQEPGEGRKLPALPERTDGVGWPE